MVCHQHKRMNSNVVVFSAFFQIRQVGFIVGFIAKAGLAIIPSLYDVMRHTWNVDTGFASHDKSFIE